MEAAKKSIKEHGKEPGRFNRILREAMQHLRKLILKIRDAVKTPEVVVPEQPIHHKSELHTDAKKPVIPEKPVEPELSKRFKSYYATYKKLEGVGKEIRKLEDKLEALQKELSKTTGFFKGKERNRIIGEIADTQVEISQKRASLSKIAIIAKCGSVDDFYTKYNASKASYNEYMKKLKAWEDKHGSGEGTSAPKDKPKGKETPKKTQENVSTPKRMLNMVSMRAELQKKKEVVKERDEHREPTIIKKKENNIGLE
jgi:hypothetical protein